MTNRFPIPVLLPLLLIAAIAWGRSISDTHYFNKQPVANTWSSKQIYLHKAMAGSLPAVAADLAVLNIFNIYANSLQASPSEKDIWWTELYNQLRVAQTLDPYFRDIYRLTEGLLAFEANKMKEAVNILANSEAYLNSSDPLLVASFIAHQELKNHKLAFELANRAIQKPDAQHFAIGFAASLLKRERGCHAAILFLQSRMHSMPKKFQQGIINRINRLKAQKECTEEI